MKTTSGYTIQEIGKMFFVVYVYGFERMPEIMSHPYRTMAGAEKRMKSIKAQAGAI